MILPGQMKALALIIVLLPGTSSGLTPSEAGEKRDVEIHCPVVTPVDASLPVYRSLTRQQLTRLGEDGHPVGLYYLSNVDLKAGRHAEAKAKLSRAAEAGLRAAYLRLADIAETDADKRAALICADRLHQNMKAD